MPVNFLVLVDKLLEVGPIEVLAIRKLGDEPVGVERILGLPQLEHDESSDKRLIERTSRKDTKIIDVPCFVALITGPYLFGDDFFKRKACYLHRRELQLFEIALFTLSK